MRTFHQLSLRSCHRGHPCQEIQEHVQNRHRIQSDLRGHFQPHSAHLKDLEVTEATKSIHQDFGGASHGSWQPQEINSRWRLCSYSPGGHFCPHYDGEYKIDSRNKSLQTCQLYLNGGTVFENYPTVFVDFISEVA